MLEPLTLHTKPAYLNVDMTHALSLTCNENPNWAVYELQPSAQALLLASYQTCRESGVVTDISRTPIDIPSGMPSKEGLALLLLTAGGLQMFSTVTSWYEFDG